MSLVQYVSLTKGKYIRYLAAGEGEEFYDLENDPDELQNLAVSNSHDAQIDEYRAGLTSELRETGAPFAETMPPRALTARE